MWSLACQNAFEKLTRYFTLAPLLDLFDARKKVIVETDTFNLVVTGIVSQHNNEEILHLIA
jgi:hypothetical protein